MNQQSIVQPIKKKNLVLKNIYKKKNIRKMIEVFLSVESNFYYLRESNYYEAIFRMSDTDGIKTLI